MRERDNTRAMAYIDVLAADLRGGRNQQLTVRFKNAAPRTIDRATALLWLEEGHSMNPMRGHGHEVHQGRALERLEVGEEVFVRTDTKRVAADEVAFP